MKNKIILFLVSTLLAGAVFIKAQDYCRPLNVVKAAKNIKAGEKITRDELFYKAVTDCSMQKDAIIYTKEADINKITAVGFSALIDIPKNAQITKGMLTWGSVRAFEKIMPGWRGYSMEIGPAEAEIIREGDLVDILAYLDAKPSPVIFTMLQKVRVLGVQKQDGKNYLFLLLAPRDAQYMYLTEKQAEKVKVVLRNRADLAVRAIAVLTAGK